MKLTAIAGLAVSVVALSTATLPGFADNVPGQTISQADIDAALQKPTTLTVWSWASFIKPGIAAFEKKYPQVKVDLVNVGAGQDEYTKISNAVMSGTGGPDVAMMDYGLLPEFVLSGALEDLTPYGVMANKDDYTPGAWTDVTVGGHVYGVPQNTGPLVFFYRSDLFNKAGIAEAPKTWPEFLDDAAKIKAKTGAAIVDIDPSDVPTIFDLISQAGVQPFTYDGAQTVGVDVADPGLQKLADLFTKLIQSGEASTDPQATDDWYQALGHDKYAGWLQGVFGQNNLLNNLQQQSGDWRVALLPAWPGQPVLNGSNGSASVVLKASPNKLAAYGFTQFLFHDRDIVAMGADRAFPALRSVLASPGFSAETNPYFGNQPTNKLYADAAEQVKANYQYLPFMSVVNSAFTATVGKAMTDKSDLFAAFKDWQGQIKDYAGQQGFTVK